MDLSSLNVDVLLHLMKFVDPVDRFNVIISGIFKGFENLNEGINLWQRIPYFGIELGQCRDSTCQLEIRSLDDHFSFLVHGSDRHRILLERLSAGGFLQNNRQMVVTGFFHPSSIHRLFRVIRSMNNLETLSLLKWELTQIEEVTQFFQSCPKLTELRINLLESQKLEMTEELKTELRSGIQRLRLFELHWDIESCPAIQEIFTWLKECTQLNLWNSKRDWRAPLIDGSLRLNSDLYQNLRDLRLQALPVEFFKCILPFCSNIETLKIEFIDQPKNLYNDIVRLRKLKDLDLSQCMGASFTIDPKVIFRNCRQLEILRVDSFYIALEDLAELEHYENLKEAHLRRLRVHSVKEALMILERCTNLRRITLGSTSVDRSKPIFPLLEELCDFIMELKDLTSLHIIYHDCRQCDHFKSLVEEVRGFILPRRPNFKFYVSCCWKFHETRVTT